MKIHHRLIVITFICMIGNANAQAPDWFWANSTGGNSYDRAICVTADAAGNVIAGGDFSSSSITFNSTTLTSGGGLDMFIVKYDATGNVLWAKSAGGATTDGTADVTTDASGNIIAVGYFSSATITFGSTTLINAGGNATNDMFIVKYDAVGNVLWAKSAGGTNIDGIGSVRADASGNLIVSGSFSSPTITFGSITLNNIGGSFDVYNVKYDASGNALWARSASGSSWNYGFANTDDFGNVIVAGTFLSPTLTFGSTTLSNAGGYDFYIAKYDAAGNLMWAKSAGGTGSDGASSVTADTFGNIIAVGTSSSPTITFGSTTLNNSGMFIVKYDAAGTVIWANSTGGVVAPSRTAYFSGTIIGSGIFGTPTITIGSTTFTNADTLFNTTDVFIVNYDTLGNVLWAKTVGGTQIDQANSIAFDASGNIITAGLFYSPTIVFGSTTMTNSINPIGSHDIFIAKLDSIFISGINDGSVSLNRASIYPNPCNTVASVQSNTILNDATLSVYNLFGQLVKQFINLYGQTFTFHRDNLPTGLYFIHLTQGNKNISTNKLIITE